VPQYDRDRVETLLKRRLEDLARTRDAMRREAEGMVTGELAHLDNHPADEGTETHDRELDVTTEVFLTEEERRIEEAMRALANGTYGVCAGCGCDIPAARLEAVPEAIRCVECQRELEGARRQLNQPRPAD
jgi:RNA polymerase-binding transcription factor DksA